MTTFVAAAVLPGAFIVAERRSASPMLPPALFRITAFTGTAIVAFAQSVALHPLTLVLLLVAPLSGKATSRIPPASP